MCHNQTGNITTLDGASLKLVDKFTYLGSSVSSTEKDIDTRLTKAWTAIYRLSIIWKLDLTDKMKRSFFQATVASILLYGCTTWTLTKRLGKKLGGNYTRMLRAILNKSWRQHLLLASTTESRWIKNLSKTYYNSLLVYKCCSFLVFSLSLVLHGDLLVYHSNTPHTL